MKMKNKKINYKPYIFLVLLAMLGGAVTGYVCSDGIAEYTANAVKPPLSPPQAVFPIVWTILYALMGVSAGIVWNETKRTENLYLFFFQLFFNYLWTIIFFGFKYYMFAFVWLVILISLVIAMIASFRKVSKAAANLQIPYLLWISFAAYLNFAAWLLNK